MTSTPIILFGSMPGFDMPASTPLPNWTPAWCTSGRETTIQ